MGVKLQASIESLRTWSTPSAALRPRSVEPPWFGSREAAPPTNERSPDPRSRLVDIRTQRNPRSCRTGKRPSWVHTAAAEGAGANGVLVEPSSPETIRTTLPEVLQLNPMLTGSALRRARVHRSSATAGDPVALWQLSSPRQLGPVPRAHRCRSDSDFPTERRAGAPAVGHCHRNTRRKPYSGTPAFFNPSMKASQWAKFARFRRSTLRRTGGPSLLRAAMYSCASSIKPRCPQQLISE
jgi:hypothetical protein